MSLSALTWPQAAVVLAGVLPEGVTREGTVRSCALVHFVVDTDCLSLLSGDWLLYTLYVKWAHAAAVWGGSCGNSVLVCFVVGHCRGETAKRLSLAHVVLRWMRV